MDINYQGWTSEPQNGVFENGYLSNADSFYYVADIMVYEFFRSNKWLFCALLQINSRNVERMGLNISSCEDDILQLHRCLDALK